MKYLTAFAAAALLAGAATLPAHAAQTDFGLQTRNNATYQRDLDAPMAYGPAAHQDDLFQQGAGFVDRLTGYRD